MAESGKPATTTDADEPLGEGGINALKAERAEKRDLKKQLDELKSEFDTLKKEKDKLDTEKLSKEEKLQKQVNELTEARDTLVKEQELAKLRREVAGREGKEVPEALLTGTDRASLEASADGLLEYAGKSTAPRKPEPNPHLGGTSEDNGDTDTTALGVLGFGANT